VELLEESDQLAGTRCCRAFRCGSGICFRSRELSDGKPV